MARLDRALVAVGNTLGALANNQLEREHQAAMAMRQENFMRIQHSLNEQSRATERASDIAERDKDRTMRKEELTTELNARRADAEADRALRRSEGEADRALRRSEGAADRAVQMAQIGDRQGKDYDARYLSQLDKIDKRIQEISDYKTQGMAEGKFIDANATAAYDNELAQLMEQRRSLAQERDITLARSGDSRYRKLSAEEVARIKKENGGQMPGAPVTETGDSGMPMAAQAPRGGSSIKLPQAPAKPPGMQAREERKQRQVAPAQEAAATDSLQGLGDWENASLPPPPSRPQQPQAWEGARQLVNVGRSIVGARDRKLNEFEGRKAAKTAAQLLAAGRTPGAEIVQRMAAVDRQTLVNDFGLSEDDLKKLGL